MSLDGLGEARHPGGVGDAEEGGEQDEDDHEGVVAGAGLGRAQGEDHRHDDGADRADAGGVPVRFANGVAGGRGARDQQAQGEGYLIAVGNRVTPVPPHRSVRAALPHTAPALSHDAKRSLGYG